MSGDMAGISNDELIKLMYLIKSTYKLDTVRLRYIWEQLEYDDFSNVYSKMMRFFNRDEWEWNLHKLSDSMKDKIDYILSKDDVMLKVDWL